MSYINGKLSKFDGARINDFWFIKKRIWLQKYVSVATTSYIIQSLPKSTPKPVPRPKKGKLTPTTKLKKPALTSVSIGYEFENSEMANNRP